MFKIYDGREAFYQWDINQRLIVADASINEVHFCNRTDSCSLVCEVYEENGLRLTNVPNILLQTSWDIRVYAYCTDHTKESARFEVLERTKPADYIYTETEVKNWEDITKEVEELSTSVEDLQTAVEELAANGAEVPKFLVYELNDITKTAIITGCDTDYLTTNYVIIPETIKGYRVKEIAGLAFRNIKDIVSVKLPDGITSIGWYAFENCTNLEYIVLPKNLSFIGESAFKGCTSLTFIDLPERIESIMTYTFSGCTRLKQVNIPDNCKTIGAYAFQGCTNLTSINLPKALNKLEVGILESSGIKNITIPEGIEEIGRTSFNKCENLEAATIPASVKVINFGAFSECRVIKDIYFMGTEQEWANITIGSANDRINPEKYPVTIHYKQALANKAYVDAQIEALKQMLNIQ